LQLGWHHFSVLSGIYSLQQTSYLWMFDSAQVKKNGAPKHEERFFRFLLFLMKLMRYFCGYSPLVSSTSQSNEAATLRGGERSSFAFAHRYANWDLVRWMCLRPDHLIALMSPSEEVSSPNLQQFDMSTQLFLVEMLSMLTFFCGLL
jgi:hypothetical protein